MITLLRNMIPSRGALLGFGVLVTILVVGCTQPSTWTKPGLTAAGFDSDMAICRRQASRDTQASPFADNDALERADMRDRLISRCMEAKGYRRR